MQGAFYGVSCSQENYIYGVHLHNLLLKILEHLLLMSMQGV